MNRFTVCLCTAVLIASGVTAAYGQGSNVTSAKDVTLTISGEADMAYVYRDSVATEAATWTAGGVAGADSDTFYSGKFTVRMEATFKDKASFVLEMENKRIEGGGNMDLAADANAVLFEQAYLSIKDISPDKLSAKFGVQDLRYELRGNGNAMLLDISEAESSFGAANGMSTTFRDTLEPAGVNFQYKEGLVSLDVFGMTVAEMGSSHLDESIYGAYFSYKLESVSPSSHVDLVAAVNDGSGDEMLVWTLGGGVNLMGVSSQGLDLFAEVYFQFGDAGRVGADDLDAGGLAYELGGRYTFTQNASKPWIELAYWFVSGDDDATDDDDDRFISYEDNDQFIIVEDNDYGLDVDTNYTAIKLCGGFSPREDLSLTANLGFFKFDEEDRIAGTEDDLGKEFDMSLRYAYNGNVSFNVTGAYLFGGDALEFYTSDEEDKIKMFVIGTNVRF